jgi:hypothetical protein
MVDIDGVVSLFGFPGHAPPGPRSVEGSFHWVDGIPHFLSATAAQHLLALGAIFELVWCSGWEERANEHLPHLLGLPRNLPFLRFGRPRALAWVDDCLDAACHAWAAARAAPTLLVQTAPEVGLTERESERLCAWARTLATPA